MAEKKTSNVGQNRSNESHVVSIRGVSVDTQKLMSYQETLAFLREGGEDDRALSLIRERYMNEFGNELIWRFPYSDGFHMGFNLVPVREGFMSLPYDVVDKEVYEVFELDSTSMFDVASLLEFMKDYIDISHDLLSAMSDMARILENRS